MDRIFYDPLRIKEIDINSNNPVARIAVRPSAYGKDIASAIHSVPYNDAAGDRILNEAGLIVRQADLTNGQNQAGQGQFVKGNKTRKEFEDTMGHSNARNQLIGLTLEHGVMTDIKEILLANTLQNQGSEDMYNPTDKKMMKIDPVALRKASVLFKVSDGMVPAEKQMSSEEYAVALQTMQSVPAIGQEYQVGDIFSYIMKTRGVDLSQFRKSPALRMHEQHMQAWQMAAQQAADAKAPFSSPQPQPSPELQQEMASSQQEKDKTLMSILTEKIPSGAGQAMQAAAAPPQQAQQSMQAQQAMQPR